MSQIFLKFNKIFVLLGWNFIQLRKKPVYKSKGALCRSRDKIVRSALDQLVEGVDPPRHLVQSVQKDLQMATVEGQWWSEPERLFSAHS